MNYIPELGDIVWMDLDPTIGREQRGRRPVLVVTPSTYNQFGLCVTVPITTKIKGYNFEVNLNSESNITGVILSNQPRSHDWKLRNVTFIESLDDDRLTEVQVRLKALLSL